MAGLVVAVYRQQNEGGALGGPISVEKTFWLWYTLAAWFLFPVYFATDSALPWGLRRVFLAHLVSFSTRAVVEIVMLYWTITWSPLYGISHDLFNAVLVSGLAALYARGRSHDLRPEAHVAQLFTAGLVVGMMVEAVFAGLFYQAVAGEMQTLYFADGSGRFELINRLTLVAVLAGCTHLSMTLAGVAGVGRRRAGSHGSGS